MNSAAIPKTNIAFILNSITEPQYNREVTKKNCKEELKRLLREFWSIIQGERLRFQYEETGVYEEHFYYVEDERFNMHFDKLLDKIKDGILFIKYWRKHNISLRFIISQDWKVLSIDMSFIIEIARKFFGEKSALEIRLIEWCKQQNLICFYL